MIVKKVKSQSRKTKPKAWQISDLLDYIRHQFQNGGLRPPQPPESAPGKARKRPQNVNPEEKIEHSGSRGFFSSTHAGQRGEMIALAAESVHSKMPVSHWIFSWKEGEQPNAAQVDELVDIFLERMGLSGHQVIYGLHWNTENYHVHIAVNRMNPETLKVIRPNNGFDIEEAHKILALVEHKQGWSREENGRYTLTETGEPAFRKRTETAPKPKAEAIDFECATGEKSAQRIAQERAHALIKNAESWPELHQKLAEKGLRFEKKGSGAIVFIGEIAVKASSIDRAFSMSRLCKKLGAFEVGTYPREAEKIAPEPISAVNLEEWKTYRAEREKARETPPVPAGNPALAAAKIRHKTERKNLLRDWAGRGFAALNVARHRLALWQKKELRRLREEQGSPKRRNLPRFESWLRAQGLTRQAERWRYRKKSMPESPPLLPAIAPGDPHAFYAEQRQSLHKENSHLMAIARGMALFRADWQRFIPPSASNLDARIALNMRTEGYSREAVIEALRRGAPQYGAEKRDWKRYAERTAAYAFGMAGEAELAGRNIAPQADARPQEALTERPRMR